MADRTQDFVRETRGTVVKSSLTGVGVTVLAVTALSPAGFGGVIGTSVAAVLGDGPVTPNSDDTYAKLPPFRSMLTHEEIASIQGQLAATAAAMDVTRAATDDRIEFVHELAERPNALSLAPLRHFTKSNPVARTAAPEDRAGSAPNGGRENTSDPYLEFAALLFGEN